MRKGDSHLELVIYLASFLVRQSPGGVPCWGHWKAPEAGGTAPVLTLTTVSGTLPNPQHAWLLCSV